MANIVMYLESYLRQKLAPRFSPDQIDEIIGVGGGGTDNANIGVFSTNNSDSFPTYLDNNSTYYILKTGSDDNPNFQLKNNAGVLANINGKVPPRNGDS